MERASPINMISYHPQNPRDAAYRGHFTNRYLLVGSDLDVSEVICINVWSPIIWKEGKRARDNFTSARLLVLDFDDGNLSLEDAVEKFSQYIHIIGTTKSHQIEKSGNPPCDRFRVVLMWERWIKDLGVYEYNTKRAANHSGADLQACNGATRFMPCTKVISCSKNGKMIKIQTPPPIRTRQQHWSRDPIDGAISKNTEYFLKYGVTDHRNVKSFPVALDMVRHGYNPDDVVSIIVEKTRMPEKEVRGIVQHAVDRKNIRL